MDNKTIIQTKSTIKILEEWREYFYKLRLGRAF